MICADELWQFYKPPPPTKPLPNLPASDAPSRSMSGSGSGSRGHSSPVQLHPNSVVAEKEESAARIEPAESELDARLIPQSAGAHPLIARQTFHDDDWINVDEALLRGNRNTLRQGPRLVDTGYESEDDMEALQPPPLQRGSTASTYGESDYATAESANASTVALTESNSQQMQYAPSFQSARSHITTASATSTVQGNDTSASERERTFVFPTLEPARTIAAKTTDVDPLATLRRTGLSPIYVSRPHPTVGETVASGLPAVLHSPRENRRDSFIDFDVGNDPRGPAADQKKAHRTSMDNGSFIDDDSDEEGEGLRASAKAENRPSVIVEQAGEENEETVHAKPFGTLGVPLSASGLSSRDRTSAATSHARSTSNASFLSRLADFPDPPIASTSTLDMDPLRPSDSVGTLRVKGKSAPAGKPSRTTLGTQNTSVYTFSSSGHLRAPDQRRSSFLDTSASPERPLPTSGPKTRENANEHSHIGFYSGPNSPGFAATSASPSTPSFRLSSLFKRPQHHRTYSDPSLAGRSSVSQYSRHNSGAFDVSEERRQSWRS